MEPFVSYAQNCEDVLLWRVLKDVKDGFYVDVGAFDPVADSVTAGFYELGWRGLNIEANPRLMPKLNSARPRDVNLCFAASDRTGFTSFYEVSSYGLSTSREDIAEMHRGAGHTLRKIEVNCVRLSDVLEAFAPSATVHFLKIDVEGMEREVLLGTNLRRHRPWIILAEATKPDSQEEAHGAFEGILLEADYRFSYFDGLNRFYVAAERWEEIGRKLAVQPNVFDRYERYQKPPA